jgi:excisionase family DNA binding protein
MSEERMLSLADVAERLNVSDQAVRRWVKTGILPAYKPGAEWRIEPAELQKFLENSRPKVGRPSRKETENSARRAYSWMSEDLGVLIGQWEKRVEEGDDPIHAHIIAVASLDVMGVVLRIGDPGETLHDRVPEKEVAERAQVADRLGAVATRAQDIYRASEIFDPEQAQKAEVRRAELRERTREIA